MKKIFAALLLLSSASFAQNRDRTRDQPPAPIQHSFEKDHSNPSNAQWSKSRSNWHANYRDNNNRSVDAYYDHRGNRIATHREIDRNDVPRNVDMKIRSQYRGTNNYSVMRVERPNAQPLFQVKLQLGSGNRTVYLDAQGRAKQYHAPY